MEKSNETRLETKIWEKVQYKMYPNTYDGEEAIGIRMWIERTEKQTGEAGKITETHL